MQQWSQPQVRAVLYSGLLLLAAGGRLAAAQPAPQVEVHVSADSIRIGEHFTLTLVAEHAADATAIFPAAEGPSALFGDLHVFRRGPVRSRPISEARRVDSVAYEVTTFALDSARVPVLPIRLAADRDTMVAGSFPRVVPVVSVVGPDAEGLRAPALLAAFPRPVWWWGLLVLVGAVLLAGGAYAWWRWQGPAEEASGDDEESRGAYEAASTRLQQLERRHPTGRQACRAFYVDLTETLRVYMAHRFDIRALERTTTEVLAALRERPEVGETIVRRLRAVLEQADLVKFADAQPPPEESQSVLRTAQDALDALEAARRRAESQAPDDEAIPA